MSRIVVLSGLQVYPPQSGGQLRTSGLIAALAEHGYSVEVYSLVGRKPEYLAGQPSGWHDERPGVREYVDRTRWWAAVQLLFYRFKLPPLWIWAVLRLYRAPTLRRMLAAADAVVVDFPFLYPGAKGVQGPVILNTHNIEANLTDGWPKGLVKALELTAARRCDALLCCSEAEAAYFTARGAPKEATYVVANGVDQQRFKGLQAKRAEIRRQLGIADGTTVLLFAASQFGPNVEGLTYVKDFVAAHQGLLSELRLHFLVAGSVSKTPEQLPHLSITGPVAAIEPYFAAADWAINAVFRGSGTNVKMGEYMTADLPILTTAVGTRGFQFKAGEQGLVFSADTLAEVLRHRALSDPKLAKSFAEAAKEANAGQINMTHAALPVVEWLRSRGLR